VLTAPRAAALLLSVAVVTACQTGSTQQPVTSTPVPSLATVTPSAAGSTGTPTPSGPITAVAVNPAGLSDEQLVGQLFMSYVYGSTATSATRAQRAANIALYGVPTGAQVIARWHLGGVILIDHNNLDPQRPTLSTGNVQDARQITALTASLQAAALADSHLPLLVSTDQEGGRVQRITDGVSDRPAQQSLAGLTPTALRCSYFTLGHQLRALGVNQDFAPVADVVRTRTGVIGDRSFGPDPSLDATDVQQAVAGLQAAGVLATLKHWPGHGSTATDSHAALAVIRESARQWRAVDRVPFQAAASTAAAIMVGHLALPALDPSGRPATLSPLLVNGQLRDALGYRGLTVTDSLYMQPMQATGSPGQVALRALAAGMDLLLESPDVPAAEQQVLGALRSSPAVRTQVVAAVQHILAAKQRTQRAPHGHC
jgi:beta-N-acetylhexosaminidase